MSDYRVEVTAATRARWRETFGRVSFPGVDVIMALLDAFDEMELACETWSARALLAEARLEDVRRCAIGLAGIASVIVNNLPQSGTAVAATAWLAELDRVLADGVVFARAQSATAFALLTAAESAIAAARAQLPGRRA